MYANFSGVFASFSVKDGTFRCVRSQSCFVKHLNISGFEKQNEKSVKSWKEKRVGYYEMKCHCGKVTSGDISA